MTIVSIDSLLETLLVSRNTDQSPEDWRKEVASRIQPPSLTIRSYGGGEINMIGQLTVSLTLGDRKCQATVLVQKGASVDLLLSTDILPWLGFHLLSRPYKDRPMIDMMGGEEMGTIVRKQDTRSLEVPHAAVPQQNSNLAGNMKLERALDPIPSNIDTEGEYPKQGQGGG